MPYNAKALKNLFEKALHSFVIGKNPQELYAPAQYLLRLPGKRVRPLLTLLAYQLFQNNIENGLMSAMAMEVFHNFTLMHDDMMDQAPLRRGKPTVHTQWNANIALLAGDVMLAKAFSLLASNAQSAMVMPQFCACVIKICEGQQMDMNFEKQQQVTEGAYLEMVQLKTGVLLGFSLQLGAQMGGASAQKAQLLYDAGVQLGISFQLQDDLLDVYAANEKFGKQLGSDIVANKKTYLWIKAMSHANAAQKETLHGWLQNTAANDKNKIAGVTAIFDALNVPSMVEKTAQQYFNRALNSLDKIQPIPPAMPLLKNFAHSLGHREN